MCTILIMAMYLAAAGPMPLDLTPVDDFDFLLGTWDLTITASLPNIPPKMKGRWTATAVADGQVVADEYRVFDAKGATAYMGLTYRAFNEQSKLWDIRYVEPRSGKWYAAKGWREGETMRVEQKGTAQSPDALVRFQYYDIADDHFRWRSERSDDQGKSWKPYGLNIEAARLHKDVAHELAVAKAKIMAADYGADLAELRRVRDEIAPLRGDRTYGYLASYWTGFASWRIAINGASNGMTAADLQSNLGDAIKDFETSIRLREDFADSYAAAASTIGWLGYLNREDAAFMQGCLGKHKELLDRAEDLEPNNPRVLWVVGGDYLFAPPEYGGNVARAVETYQRMADESPAPMPRSPWPDWGKPEALMSLAFARLQLPKPDPKTAIEDARAALRLQPSWSYVKNVLVPQIEAATK